MKKIYIYICIIFLSLICFIFFWKPANKDNVSTKVILSNESEMVSSSTKKEIDTFDWQIYRNEEYGFEINYPNNWFVRVDESFKNKFGRVYIDFSDNGKFPETGEPVAVQPKEISICIYNIENNTVVEYFNSFKNLSKEFKIITLRNGQIVYLYSISEKNKERDGTWDMTLPVAGALISNEKYYYDFAHSVGNGKENQQEEIEIIEKMIGSLIFL